MPWQARTRRQLTRFILICATFLLVQIAILALGLVAIEAVNIARAYVGGESFYAQSQKEAVISLHRYVRSGEQADFDDFTAAMQKPLGDRMARQALEQTPPDLPAAYAGLLQGGNDPADIKGLANFFVWFGQSEYLGTSLQDWRSADRELVNLYRLGGLIQDLQHRYATLPKDAPADQRLALELDMGNTLRTVDQLDRSLTEIEDSFAGHIGATARFAGRVVAVILVAASLQLWMIGGIIVWRMYRKTLVADEELENSEERFRDFAEIASDWFWEMDADLKVSYISDRATELFGVKPQEMLGKSRIGLGQGDLSDPHWQAHEATLAARLPFRDFRYCFNLAEDHARYVSVSGKPVIDANGAFCGYRGTGNDVTLEVQAMTSLRLAKEQAEIANRTKTTFLANMSHELRTPLNAILGFSEVIRDQLFGLVGNHRYVDYAGSINDAGRHLLRLINDLLDISRIEAGRMELQESVIDLRNVIHSCELLTRVAARNANIDLSIVVAPEIGHLNADERKLKQALLNLISNAIKFTPAGGVTIDARLLADGRVSIAVSDTGIGIRASDIPKALTPFMQVDSGLDRRHEGSGLGLPLAKALIDLHQGELQIISVPDQGTPDHGTTVTVILPAARHLPLATVSQIPAAQAYVVTARTSSGE
jgi:PAS domain S-box-containing protein